MISGFHGIEERRERMPNPINLARFCSIFELVELRYNNNYSKLELFGID